MVISGTPAILYFAIGEASYRSFLMYGRVIAAIVEPRNVTAITSVEASVRLAKLKMFHTYSAETISPGTTMSASAQSGVRVRGSTCAAASGSSRSNAAAKITRVEERNTVPAQPKNHMLIARITTNCRIGLEVRNIASIAG